MSSSLQNLKNGVRNDSPKTIRVKYSYYHLSLETVACC